MNDFLKLTKGKMIAFGVLLLSAIYVWMPTLYAENLAQFFGGFGKIVANISIVLFFPVIILYSIFFKFKFLFFMITLVYNYFIICVVDKVFKKFNPNLRSFFIIFLVLEIVVYIIGFFFTWHAYCQMCQVGQECSPCPSGNYSAYFMYGGIIPNLIISFIVSVYISKHKKKK